MPEIPNPLTKEAIIMRFIDLQQDPEMIKRFLGERDFAEGERLITQGEKGDTMYFISQGSVKVEILVEDSLEPQMLGVLGPGDFFGEMALVKNEPRSATVTALEPVKTFTLARPNWNSLGRIYPMFINRITQVANSRQAQNKS